MSYITPGTIQSIASSLNITKLSDEAAKTLAPDAEYKLREVVQDALKCMRHCRRNTLTTHDVSQALKMMGAEPIYGLSGQDALQYRRAAGHPDLFYLPNRELSFDELFGQGLPAVPAEIALVPHWLAVDGKQPKIPQNVPLTQEASKLVQHSGARKRARDAGDPATERPVKQQAVARVPEGPAVPGAVLKLPVKHVITEELQAYYRKVMAVLHRGCSGAVSDARSAAAGSGDSSHNRRLLHSALLGLSQDAGLQPLVPYFVAHIADGLRSASSTVSDKQMLIALTTSLTANPYVSLELYLHQLMAALMTCTLAEQQSDDIDAMLMVREQAAVAVASLCSSYSQPQYNLGPRTASFLLKTLLEPGRGLPTQYGCLVGLAALGDSTVETLLLPKTLKYLQRLQRIPLSASQGGSGCISTQYRKQQMANDCLGALLVALSQGLRRFLAQHAAQVARGDCCPSVGSVGLVSGKLCVNVPLHGVLAGKVPSSKQRRSQVPKDPALDRDAFPSAAQRHAAARDRQGQHGIVLQQVLPVQHDGPAGVGDAMDVDQPTAINGAAATKPELEFAARTDSCAPNTSQHMAQNGVYNHEAVQGHALCNPSGPGVPGTGIQQAAAAVTPAAPAAGVVQQTEANGVDLSIITAPAAVNGLQAQPPVQVRLSEQTHTAGNGAIAPQDSQPNAVRDSRVDGHTSQQGGRTGGANHTHLNNGEAGGLANGVVTGDQRAEAAAGGDSGQHAQSASVDQPGVHADAPGSSTAEAAATVDGTITDRQPAAAPATAPADEAVAGVHRDSTQDAAGTHARVPSSGQEAAPSAADLGGFKVQGVTPGVVHEVAHAYIDLTEPGAADGPGAVATASRRKWQSTVAHEAPGKAAADLDEPLLEIATASTAVQGARHSAQDKAAQITAAAHLVLTECSRQYVAVYNELGEMLLPHISCFLHATHFL